MNTEERNLFLSLLAVLVSSIILLVYISVIGIHSVVAVERIIDGDTFEASKLGSIRLADVDAPERTKLGFTEAKYFLSSLISDKMVFLSGGGTTAQDRPVCLVYVRQDSTYILNVNLKMVNEGHAWFDDHPNEFTPSTWTLHIFYPVFLETLAENRILLIFTSVLSAILIIYLGKKSLKKLA